MRRPQNSRQAASAGRPSGGVIKRDSGPGRKERSIFLSHAITLAEARSRLAALARRAYSDEASAEYERVLLHLDVIHGDYIPGISDVYDESADILFGVAEQAIEDLVTHGIDALQVDLLLEMLDAARAKDVP